MKKKLTKEEKELLIKDLFPRIPTDLLVKVPGEEEPKNLKKRIRWMIVYGRAKSLEDCLDGLIPYLRPLSSMTEDEKKELENICVINYNEFEGGSTLFDDIGFDWLNSHHFDYRGLIEKGLALEAPKGMYNLENK